MNSVKIKSIIIATDASNPGIRLLSPSDTGVSTGDVVGDGDADIVGVSAAGEGVKVAVATAGERVGAGVGAGTDAGVCVGVCICVGFGVDVEVANSSFHAFIPPSIL